MQNSRRLVKLRSAWLWLVPLAFVLVFFYQPLVAIFRLAFSKAFVQGLAAFKLEQVTRPLGFTVWQALLSTLLTLALGLPSAYLFSHFTFPGRKALRLLTLLPFILPTVVTAAAFNALLGPRGLLNLGLMALFKLPSAPIHLLNSLPAILLAHVFYNTSVVIRVVSASWSRLSGRLHQAAQTLGASPWQTFKTVTLPLLMPSILSASLLVFLFNFSSFGVVLMLGGPRFATLEVEIYTQAMQMLNLPLASLLSLVQLSFTLLITLLYNRQVLPRVGKTALNLESTPLPRPRKPAEKLLAIVLIVTLVLLVAAPLLSLVARSFLTLEAARGERGDVQTGLTLRYYLELFQNRTGSLFYVPPLLAIRNSILYALVTVVLSGILGLLAAYAMQRQGGLRRVLEPVLMLPLGASAVTLGLGFLVVFNHPPFNNPRFPLLIPIAHTLVALPLVLRVLTSALRGIPESLRQAARVLGAGPLRVFWSVDLPLLLRPLLAGMVFAFTVSLGEFGASSFLSTPEMPTIPVAIYRYISQPGALNYGQALAMSTILLLVCALGTLVIERTRLPGEELF